ncbi:hypothetical protein C8Q74DRAFT_1252676 [Fomes fomentarius]|nr:hypothetical protein C8Q74DRAFT_1252676 [Fomes fomentarius]
MHNPSVPVPPQKPSIQSSPGLSVALASNRTRSRPAWMVVHCTLNITVSEAERILAAEYYVYRHGGDGSERIRCH